jgi:hypothetical protein
VTNTQFAHELGITPEHLRRVVRENGHYYGVTPVKQANGRLVWPEAELDRLKGGTK